MDGINFAAAYRVAETSKNLDKLGTIGDVAGMPILLTKTAFAIGGMFTGKLSSKDSLLLACDCAGVLYTPIGLAKDFALMEYDAYKSAVWMYKHYSNKKK